MKNNNILHNKIDLSSEQRRAIEEIDGQTLLLAVPGSGKTTTLIARIGRMIYECGVAPGQILVITYTKSAATDMKARFAHFFGSEYAGLIHFSTINSFCYSVVMEYARRSGHKKPEDDFDTERHVRELYEQVYDEKFPEENDIRSLVQQIAYIKNMQLSESEIEKLKTEDLDVAPMYDAYVSYMKKSRKMDYDDQLVFAFKILKGNLEGIRDHYAEMFRYVLLDEAQDTSKIQHDLIGLIAEKYGNFFMVGDEDQSIYGFRAAYPKALIDFKDKYPDGKVYYLQTNYRSAKNIVTTAGKVIRKNKDRFSKEISPYKEADGSAVMKEIRRSEQYEELLKDIEKVYSIKEHTAVLYRNNESALPLISLMMKINFPYRCRKTDSLFFSSKVIRDAVDILQFTLYPASKSIISRIYYKFNLRIMKNTLYAATKSIDTRDDQPILKALYLEETNAYKKEKIKELIKNFKIMRKKNNARAAIRKIRFSLNYVNEKNDKLFILENIAYPDETINDFLNRLPTVEEAALKGRNDRNAVVTLSTIHSSKGLEYDNVILIDAINDILPSNDNDIEEERRIFYVAITRAKKRLLMYKYPGYESPFIDEAIGKKRHKIKLSNKPKIKKIAPEELQKQIEQYKTGDIVRHKEYGPGIVIIRKNDRIKIDFGDKGIKEFLITMCLEKGLLSRDAESSKTDA